MRKINRSTAQQVNRLKNLLSFLPFYLFVFLHLSLTNKAWAQVATVGTSGAQFLKLPVNARAIGMGEAYSAVADGADAIYWNPAGLGRLEGKSISFMHAVYLQNIFYDFASYAQSFRKIGTLALGAQYLSTIDTIDATDEFGAPAGTFRPQDLAISFAWAREFPEWGEESKFILGITGKYIRSKIIETAQTGAVDIGITWPMLEKKLWLAVSGQNFGAGTKFKDEVDTLPINVRVGASYLFTKSFLLALDANFPRDNNPNAAIGAEYKGSLTEKLSLAGRIGFNSRVTRDIDKGLSSLSAGFGFEWKTYGIDFAWVPFGNLGNSYRISLSAKF